MLLRLPRNVAALSALTASAEHMRFGATTGIKLEMRDDVVRLQATDGRVLGVVQCYPENDVEKCEQVVDAQDLLPDEAVEAIIDGKEWKKGLGLEGSEVERSRGAYHDGIVISTQEDEVVFATMAGKKTIRQTEGRWPIIDQVIPKAAPLYVVRVDPKLVIRLMQAAMAFTPDEACGVELVYYDRKTPLGVIVKNHETGQVFDGLLVPLTNGEDSRPVQRIEKKPDVNVVVMTPKALTHVPDVESESEDEEDSVPLPKLSECFYAVDYDCGRGSRDPETAYIPVPLADTLGIDEAFRRTVEIDPVHIVSHSMNDEEVFDAQGELVQEWTDDSEDGIDPADEPVMPGYGEEGFGSEEEEEAQQPDPDDDEDDEDDDDEDNGAAKDADVDKNEKEFLAAYRLHGAKGVVSKVRKQWLIWDGKPGFPLYKTRREAMDMADQYAVAVSERHDLPDSPNVQ